MKVQEIVREMQTYPAWGKVQRSPKFGDLFNQLVRLANLYESLYDHYRLPEDSIEATIQDNLIGMGEENDALLEGQAKLIMEKFNKHLIKKTPGE